MGLGQTDRTALYVGPRTIRGEFAGRGVGEEVTGADVWKEGVAEVHVHVDIGVLIGLSRQSS